MNKWAEVKAFFKDLAGEAGKDEIAVYAAAISFYAWLSLFPLLLAAIAAFGIYLGTEEARDYIFRFLDETLPVLETSSFDISGTLSEIEKGRGSAGLVSLLGLLWTGTQVIIASIQGFNRVFNVQKKSNFIMMRLRALLFLVGLGTLVIVAFAVGIVISYLPIAWLVKVLGFIVQIGLLACIFALSFRVLPKVDLPWKFALIGGLVTSILWLVANAALVHYFSNFTNFSAVYGPLGGIVVVLLACYYLAFVTLAGAEVTHVLNKRYGRNGKPAQS